MEGIIAQLRICTLGSLSVTLGDQSVSSFESAKVRALLVYLAVEAGRPHTRETLAGMLWPDYPQSSALTSLRNALANLRQAIGDKLAQPPYLFITRQAIQFNLTSDCWLDLAEFNRGLSQSYGERSKQPGPASIVGLQAAIDVYHGRFLEDFMIPDSGAFEEWVLLKRERLNLEMMQGLRRLADYYEALGDYNQALPLARKQVELEPWQEEGHRQLMRLYAYSGMRSSALVQYATCQRTLESELGVQPEQETNTLYADICAGRFERKAAQPVDEPPFPGPPPYKGMQHFDENDEGLFFGREKLTTQLVNRLQEMANQEAVAEPGSRILTVVGASGIGKSSLVRGGIIPALQRNGRMADHNLPDSWRVLLITPTDHPLETLAFALKANGFSESELHRLIEEMKGESDCLAVQLRNSGYKLLLIVDQLEELFTLCRDDSERTAFIDNLLSATEAGVMLAMIALRTDFYTHCSRYPRLRQAISSHQEFIGAMEGVELRRTIEAPAEKGGWVIEPGLVDLILRDVGDEPGALPLLSHALLETWKHREGRLLTLKGYTATSGVRGAIATTADHVYREFTPKEKTIARRVFLRLTELGEGTLDTRRRATLAELATSPSEIPEVESVLKMLADARLVILTEGSAEVAHEALIREWPTLRDWLDEDREGLHVQRHLTEAARAWDEINRDPGELYRGARLVRAQEWAGRGRNNEELNDLERSFLIASQEMVQRDAAEQQAAQRREIEAAQALAQTEKQRAQEQARFAGRLRQLVITLATALILVAVMVGVASLFAMRNAILAEQNAVNASYAQTQQANAQRASTQAVAAAQAWATQQNRAEIEVNSRATAEANALVQRDLANQQEHLARARELALAANFNLNTDPELSLLLAIQAVEEIKEVPAEVQQALHRAVLASRAQLTILAHERDVYTIAFSPDGKLLASAGGDKVIKVWDSSNGQLLHEMHGHTATVLDVEFSPDGKIIASSSEDESVKIWGAANGQLLMTLENRAGITWAVHFSPDGGSMLTTDEDGAVRLWNVDSGEESLKLSGHSGVVLDATFSPDNPWLATAGEDGTAILWDLRNGRQMLSIQVGQSIFSIAFSPDGTRLVTGDNSGAVRIWDARTGQGILTIAGHNTMIKRVAFSPDGLYMVTASQDGITKIWDVGSREELYALHANAGAVYDAAFSPECVGPPQALFEWCGPRLATANRDGTVKIWDVTPRGSSELMVLPGFDGHAVEPERIYTSFISGSEVLGQTWDAASQPPGELLSKTIFSGFPAPVATGCLGRDHLRMATITQDGFAQVWDTITGELVITFAMTSHKATINKADLSPDNQWLATASDDGTVRVWDTAGGEEVLSLSGHEEYVWDVTFSSDGELLATSGSDGTTRIWDAKSGEALLVLRGHSMPVNVVAFSADGENLVSAGMDGTARIWDVTTGKSLMTLSGHTATVIGAAFSPDGMHLATGSYDGSVKVWDVSGGTGGGRLIFSLPVNGWPINIHFSPDGNDLLVGTLPNQLVYVFLMDVEELTKLARSRVTRNLTQQECQQYLHLAVCP
jgi:WD40 repeat protein/DNA-binding SARP family transcriptional activator